MRKSNNDHERSHESSTSGRISRRRALQTVGAGAVAGLAGCLGGDGDNGGDDGGDDSGGDSSDDPIKIAHLGPTQLDMGLGSQRSAELAVDEINANGGIMDREIEFIGVDDEGSPATAQTEAERLIDRENIDFMLGTFTSESTQGIMDYVGDSDVPFFITGSADTSTLTDTIGEDYERYKNIFRVGPANSSYQAQFLADYAEFLADEYGWTQIAHVPENAAWTDPFTELVPGYLEERGLDVVMDIRLSRDTSDFVPVLNDVEEAGADVLLKEFAHIPGPGMLSAWRENEYPFAQEGINVASMSPQFWDDTSGGCLYESTAESGGGGKADITDKTIQFAEDYQDTYADEGRPTLPMYMGYGSYDAVYVYKNAVERAGTIDFENSLDDIVAETLNTEYTGASGIVTFHQPDHEWAHDVVAGTEYVPFPLTQWQAEGAKECVFPTEFASADHVVPDWI